jgi:methyl-accepting chemotaxis protein
MRLQHYLLAALTAAAIFVAVEAGLLLRDSRKAILFVESDEHTEALKLDAVLTDASRTLIVVGATAGNIERTTRTWQSKQNAVADQAMTAEAQLTSDLRDLGTLESSLNSMIVQQSAWLHGSEESASMLMSDTIQPTLVDIQRTAANSAASSQTLSSGLLQTMPQIESTAENTAKTTAHIEGTTKDVQDFAHRELAPVKGTWNAIKAFLFEIAGPAASVATSLK